MSTPKFWPAALLAMAAWVIPALGAFPGHRLPTPEQAVKHAKSVVLVEWVRHENQVHSFVKEVWRSDPQAAAVPAVGSEYGRPMPPNIAGQATEGLAIFFEFGRDNAGEFSPTFRIPVTKNGLVPYFQEEAPVVNDQGIVTRTVDEPLTMKQVRSKVKKAKPAPEREPANLSPKPASREL